MKNKTRSFIRPETRVQISLAQEKHGTQCRGISLIRTFVNTFDYSIFLHNTFGVIKIFLTERKWKTDVDSQYITFTNNSI